MLIHLAGGPYDGLQITAPGEPVTVCVADQRSGTGGADTVYPHECPTLAYRITGDVADGGVPVFRLVTGDEAPVPVLSEQITDLHGTYRQEWHCQPPAAGVSFHVVRCTWSPDHSVRKIYEIKVGPL